MIADVVIAGGGFAGLALALALRQGLGASFRIVIADPTFAANARPDPRASAIAAAARRMFETLGVWDAVAGNAQPILDMIVTDSKLRTRCGRCFSPSRAKSSRMSRSPT